MNRQNLTNESLNELSELKNGKGIEVLKACGDECCKTSKLYVAAKNIRDQHPETNDLDILFNAYKHQHYNTPALVKNKNKITLIFDECTCALVKDGINNPYLCHCTIGYSKTIFETLFEKEVGVVLEESILRGDEKCIQIIEIID